MSGLYFQRTAARQPGRHRDKRAARRSGLATYIAILMFTVGLAVLAVIL